MVFTVAKHYSKELKTAKADLGLGRGMDESRTAKHGFTVGGAKKSVKDFASLDYSFNPRVFAKFFLYEILNLLSLPLQLLWEKKHAILNFYNLHPFCCTRKGGGKCCCKLSLNFIDFRMRVCDTFFLSIPAVRRKWSPTARTTA